MDDMRKNVAPDGHSDAVQQGSHWQQQGFPGGETQFAGFSGGWGYWPYGGFSGGMCGMAQGDIHRGCETPADGSQSWEMPEHPFPSDSLIGLLLQSNSVLFAHLYASKEVEKVAFSGLSDEEQKTLKDILTKLLASWGNQGQTKI